MTYKHFFNNKTGESVYVPAGRYGTFLLSVRKAVQFIKYSFPKYYCCHLTLTQAEVDNNLSYEHLHRVMKMINAHMKRQDAAFKYIAVKEYNSSGLRQGTGNLHYHVLIFYSQAYAMPDVERIEKSWGLGFVKITAPKLRVKLHRVVSYLGKYIGKGYEFDSLNGDKKSFTASQIPSCYKLAADRLRELRDRVSLYSAEKYKCTFTKVSRVDCRGEKHLVMFWESDWVCLGLEAEAF